MLGWPSGVLAGIAALLAIYFAATGLRGRLLLTLTGAAIVLGALEHPDRQHLAGCGRGADYTRRPWPGRATALRSRPRT